MARIRTIKPEFPHSESMGRVTREARLCFVLIWTLCDDSGRTRGNSRILASLLYPYDDDAKNLIESWLDELEREDCIARYVVDGSTYLQIINWKDHQKIDKPSPSKLPEFDEASRTVAKPREASRSLIGMEGIGMEGKGREQSRQVANESRAPARVTKPVEPLQLHETLPTDTWDEWLEFRRSKRWPNDATTLRKQLNVLAPFDQVTQRQMLDTSMQSGWQGLFPPKGRAGEKPKQRPMTVEEAEAQERARAAG